MRRGRGFETRTRITGPRRAGPWESASPGGEDAPDDFTETNVQVEGVDEADIIETDGNRIYFLHGDAFVVVDSWPPEETSLASITPIGGLGHSMFVADGRAVVFSMVYDDEDRFGGEGGCGFIGPPLPLVDAALPPDVHEVDRSGCSRRTDRRA